MGKDLDEVEDFLYLELDDALEIYGAIIGSSAAQATDHLRNREALAGALGSGVDAAIVADTVRERLQPLA